MHKIKLIVICLFLSQSLFSQIKFKQEEKDKNGNISFISIELASKLTSSDAEIQILLKQIGKTKSNTTLKQVRSFNDNQNYTHHIYQAYFDGIEIKGMGYAIHSKNNIVEYANGNLFDIGDLLTKPTLSNEIATEKALEYYKKMMPTAIVKTATAKQLLFCNDVLNNGTDYFLTYQILIQTNKISDNYFIYVDTKSGEVLNKEPLVCQGHNKTINPPNAPGTAETKYSGIQNITSDGFNGSYRLREDRNGVNIITKNALNTYDEILIASSSTDFFDNSNTWTLANQSIDQPATDAHWGAEKVLDYWQSQRSRNSIDNLGMPLRSYVHYGASEDNAYWTGGLNPDLPNSMIYGDGNTYFRPLTSLDVVAHEFGHGVCQFTSGSIYGYAESGALNEGFSDIWGAAIEAWAAPNKQRWLIGEEITKISPYYLRSMSNPPSGPFSPSSDTYLDANWNNNADPHYRSGVLNKWFYLLSEGGTGTNSNGNNYNVSAITIEKAANIAYMTEQNLFPSDGYITARNVSIQVTRNFYGVGSCEEIAVTKAWYAVGVGANFNGSSVPAVPTITGPAAICPGATAIYSIGNYTGNGTITWSSNNPNVTIIAFGNGQSANVSNNANIGSANITVSVSSCSGGSTSATKQIYLGIPTSVTGITTTNIIPNPSNCMITKYLYTANGALGITNFKWYYRKRFAATDILFKDGPDNFATSPAAVLDATCGYLIIKVEPYSACIPFDQAIEIASNRCPPYIDPTCTIISRQTNIGFNIAPNPSNGQFDIILNSKNKNESIKEVRIINKMGNLVYNQKFYENKIKQTIRLNNQPTDIYIVEIFDGTQWQTENLSLQR